MIKALDVFNHYLPPAFYDRISKLGGRAHMLKRASMMPAMSDLDYRLKLMDAFEGYAQIPCIVSPNVEMVVPPEHTAPLARFANEQFKSLCNRYPDKFPSFVAVLPLDSIDKAIKEAQYAVSELGAAGVQVFTNHQGHCIDSADYMALYEELDKLDTTLWIHPIRTFKEPYYKDEELEKYELWWTMMWPIETTMAASRLVYSGIFQRCPNLRIILHHAGGMLPMMGGRLDNGLQLYSTRTSPEFQHLVKSPVQGLDQGKEFRKYFADSATFGSQAAIECGISFFGLDHMVFASDLPFDPEDGFGYVRRTLANIKALNMSDEEKDMILYKNAERLLKLKLS